MLQANYVQKSRMMLCLGAKNIHSGKEHISMEVKEFIVLNKTQSFYSLPKGIHLVKRDS